ncbi:hypothetical protein COCMIDRAFT_83931 [Bipolaris oryzae ATCC 44560]|uniref:rRNA adenine N(6)-methyltransferase n=1 Tax=Bipolaris oryzae ATCC 44560 TaxID=930090 RepID=W6ZD30_COCMI|nr:uncharacterized protein COCMIDRAFT_83931 [Bipolaris oryzae ATCC 44560]EUC49682.1 hypothetical protein COCMIDRAFT_83931 [Bipolaris oryzae ATCC 44560]
MIRIRPTISRNIWRSHISLFSQGQTRFATVKHGGKRGRPKGTNSYWSEEKLETDEKYPLSFAMNELIHPSLEPRVKKRRGANTGPSALSGGIHVRAQIVSPDLCDDVIKYAGPTLEKHKGCDILDINPGAGLWSQKLHDYLQPRSHVLLEPRFDRFEDLLEPLLNAPGSKYSLIEKDPTDLDTYSNMVTEGVFPQQTIRDPRDPKAQEPNNTLLVTGSLIWDPPLSGLGFDSMAKQIHYHLSAAARSNELFHAYGLIRTLFWMQQEDFGTSMADSISTMYKTNRFMEMSQSINVLVNGTQTPRKVGKGSSGREPHYSIESTVHALRRGKKLGMELPPHRRDRIHEFAADIERISNGTGRIKSAEIQEYLHEQQLAGKSTTGLLSEGLIEHYEIEKTIRQKYPDIEIPNGTALQSPKTRKKIVPEDHPAKDQIRKYLSDCAQINFTQRLKSQIEAIADVGEAMYELEGKILRMQDGPEKDAAMAKLEELNASWEEGNRKMPLNYARAPATELDDRLALRAPPAPRVQWDSRPFEPLTMYNNEAWPTNRLSLISTEPIPQPTAEYHDYYDWLHDFIHGLYANPSDTIPEALDKMQHGLRDIMEECPSLRDPDKGGRLQMDHFRVRLLTPEMITEMLDAYLNWPFKAPGSDHNKYFRHRSSAHHFTNKQTTLA